MDITFFPGVTPGAASKVRDHFDCLPGTAVASIIQLKKEVCDAKLDKTRADDRFDGSSRVEPRGVFLLQTDR
ncbi:MAG TPA: hypothetical protein VGL70_08825 [Candidatus Binatia bacterium]